MHNGTCFPRQLIQPRISGRTAGRMRFCQQQENVNRSPDSWCVFGKWGAGVLIFAFPADVAWYSKSQKDEQGMQSNALSLSVATGKQSENEVRPCLFEGRSHALWSETRGSHWWRSPGLWPVFCHLHIWSHWGWNLGYYLKETLYPALPSSHFWNAGTSAAIRRSQITVGVSVAMSKKNLFYIASFNQRLRWWFWTGQVMGSLWKWIISSWR